MTRQAHLPHYWPNASGADVPSRTALVRHALFNEGRMLPGLVASHVMDSWRRCQKAGLAPDAKPVFEAVHRKKVNYLESRDHALLRAANGPFEELQASLSRSHCNVMLTDRHGVLLRTTPQRADDSALLKAACRPGVDLGEIAVGTTAPGLAARTGSPCQLGAGEHFYDALRHIRCVAAPIRNRRGTVVAVLDLTIEHRSFGFNAAWLVGSYASAIENRLRIAQTRQQVLLKLHVSPSQLDGAAVGLVAVDELGRIGWMNELAAALTSTPGDAHVSHCEEALGLGLEQLLALTKVGRPQPLLLPSGLSVWLVAQFRKLGDGIDEDDPVDQVEEVVEPPPTATPLAAEPVDTLARLNRQMIERALSACGGNVSKAARMLKVSRGLLYRRLRGDR